MKNDLKQMGLFTIGPFLAKILSFVLLPVISYFVSLSDYGQYTLFTVLLLYFQTFITLTTEQYYLRSYSDQNALNVRKVLFILFFVTTLFISIIIGILHLEGIFNRENFILYLMALLVSYFTMLQDIYSRTFRSRNMGNYYSISTIVVQVGNFLACIIFVMVTKSVFGLMLGQLVAMIIGTIVMRNIVQRKVINFEVKNKLRLTDVKNILKKAIVYSLPLLPGVFLWVVQTSIGRIFLAGNSFLLGIFGVGFKFSSITNLFVTSFIIFWEPKIFRLFDNKESDESYVSLVKKYRNLYSLTIEIIILGIFIFNPIIMIFMEKSYRAAMYILPTMILSNYINGYNYFEGFGPQLTGKTHLTIVPLLFSLFINIGILVMFGKGNLLVVAFAANAGLIVQLGLNAVISNKIVPNIDYLKSIVRIIAYSSTACLFYMTKSYFYSTLLSIVIFLILNFKIIIEYKVEISKYLKGRFNI